MKQYQHAIGMNENGIIDQTVLDALFSSVKQSIARSPMTYDLQFVKAMQLLED